MNSSQISPRERLIVALDFPSQEKALSVVSELGDSISFYKIGLQLYTAAGPAVIEAVAASGARIFLDLKLHDIPNTVAKAVTAAGNLGAQMLTLHLSGGSAMLEAAVKAKPPQLLLLGVTVLTSATRDTLRETGIDSEVPEQVVRLAELARGAGLDGLITSPQEVPLLREHFGKKMLLVTPGIRPSWAAAGDQKRFTTPGEAVRTGADYLVIGRPITDASDPRSAVQRIVDELPQ